MSRITREEVHSTAHELNAKGIKPTIIKIRELLGKGSYSTIGKHLDEWEAPEEAQAEAPEVPESLMALLPQIWSTCYAEAEAMSKARTDKLRTELDECRESLDSAQKVADEAEAEIEQLQIAITESKAETQKAMKDGQTWKERAEISEARAEELRQRAEAAEEMLSKAIDAKKGKAKPIENNPTQAR